MSPPVDPVASDAALPALRKQRHELRLRIDRRFIDEWRFVDTAPFRYARFAKAPLRAAA